MTLAAEIGLHLQQETNWIEQLNQLLREERDHLASRQFNELDAIAQKKLQLSQQIEQSAKERINLIHNTVQEPDPRTALQAFIHQCSPEEAKMINHLNQNLADQLTLCRELNAVNGQVIATNLHTRQEFVDIMTGKDKMTNTYTATGSIDTTTQKGKPKEA